MAANPPLGTVGEVVEGEEVGRFVEVLDGSADGGGYLISTYADDQKMHDAVTKRVETYDDVNSFFFEKIWTIEWADPGAGVRQRS
jgi:hypothetical protein